MLNYVLVKKEYWSNIILYKWIITGKKWAINKLLFFSNQETLWLYMSKKCNLYFGSLVVFYNIVSFMSFITIFRQTVEETNLRKVSEWCLENVPKGDSRTEKRVMSIKGSQKAVLNENLSDVCVNYI